MWVIFGLGSVIFTFVHLFFAFRHSQNIKWISLCAFSFVLLTLLSEFSMISSWVQNEDWGSLMDVVPSLYNVLVGYVVIMIFINGLAVLISHLKK